MTLNSNFDPIPNEDLDVATNNLCLFIDIVQKYAGVLPDKVINLLIEIETDLCQALCDRGIIEIYLDLDDVPVIEVERVTDEMPAVPELEPEWSPDDTQPINRVFEEYIETLPLDDEDYLS
jgi:hypothetical protein